MNVLIIDSYNMIHRAKHGFNFGEDHITFGFFRCLKSEISRHKPDMVYIVSEGYPKHRHDISSEYKANRKKELDPDFFRQKNDIFEICTYLPVSFARHPDYECDDVIAMLCTEVHPDDNVTICSSDSDFIQLLDSENISLWNPVKKKYIDPWPVDYCTWKSLKGDSSDNIKGVKGVGEKTATKLASNSSLMEDFFTRNVEHRKDFNDAMSLIKFADLDPADNKLEMHVYGFNEPNLYESFNTRSFKSIVGKSWGSWKETMEFLNERTTTFC